jgi:hypothetical protein
MPLSNPTVQDRSFIWPRKCACCGAFPDGKLTIFHIEKISAIETTRSTSVPCCKRCQGHQSAGVYIICGVPIAFGGIVLMFAPAEHSDSLFGVLMAKALLGLIAICGLVVSIRAIRRILPKDPKCAVHEVFVSIDMYKGRVRFTFASPEYAEDFIGQNPGAQVRVKKSRLYAWGSGSNP